MVDSLTCAALLAGGQSRRMGVPKHDVPIDGRAMGHVMAALASDCCDAVIVAGPPTALPEFDHAADLDGHVGHGPLAGIEAALASGRAPRWLILPCDMPRLTSDACTELLRHPGQVCAFENPERPGRPLHLPLAVDQSVQDSITRSLDAGVRSIGQWLARSDVSLVAAPNAACLFNINSPEDLNRPSA